MAPLPQINHCTETPAPEAPVKSCPVTVIALWALGFIALGAGAMFIATQTLLPVALITLGVAILFFGCRCDASDQVADETSHASMPPLVSIATPLSDVESAQIVHVATPFSEIDSFYQVLMAAPNRLRNRSDFLEADLPAPPLIIGKSGFVSNEMAKHLMRNKKNLALGIKYAPGDKITNMEGALHTFVTPMGPIMMSGDYRWEGALVGKPFADNTVRNVILSAAIQPDFEFDTVIMSIVKLETEVVQGIRLSEGEMDRLLQSVDRSDEKDRAAYDDQLRRHMIYHLTEDGRLPSAVDCCTKMASHIAQDPERFLEQLIEERMYPDNTFKNTYAIVNCPLLGGSAHISLEVLFNLYRQQLMNEFFTLSGKLPQGFVYTISPPVIFTKYINGNANLLNRMQAFALKYLITFSPDVFKNLRVFAFNDYADAAMIPLYQKVFEGTEIQVIPFKDLYNDSSYIGPEGLALVLHNNSDGFGQNIEFEGVSSMDGMIGSFSNAACLLRRDRPDLVENIL